MESPGRQLEPETLPVYRFRATWQRGAAYRRGDVAARGPRSYLALADHVAGCGSEPGHGEQWTRFWDVWDGGLIGAGAAAPLRELAAQVIPLPVAYHQTPQLLSKVSHQAASPRTRPEHPSVRLRESPAAAEGQPAPSPPNLTGAGHFPEGRQSAVGSRQSDVDARQPRIGNVGGGDMQPTADCRLPTAVLPLASEILDDSEEDNGSLNVAVALSLIRDRATAAQQWAEGEFRKLGDVVQDIIVKLERVTSLPIPVHTVRAEAWRRKAIILGVRDADEAEAVVADGTREWLRLLRKLGSGETWTPQEAARNAVLESLDQMLVEIDKASAALLPDPPEDFCDDKYWPVLGGRAGGRP